MTGIIVLRLGHEIDPARNGEHAFIDRVAHDIHYFVDVGANIGEWSTAVLERAPEAHGCAIEPGLVALKRLRAAKLPNLEILPAVAGASAGTVTFFEEPNAGQTSSVHARSVRAGAVAREVRMVTIDDLLAKSGRERIDFLKIDAEGHDLRVLQGAREALRRRAIRYVQFEYNRSWIHDGSSLKEAMELLEENGYTVQLLTGQGLHKFPYSVYGDFYHYSNFIAIAPEATPALADFMRGTI